MNAFAAQLGSALIEHLLGTLRKVAHEDPSAASGREAEAHRAQEKKTGKKMPLLKGQPETHRMQLAPDLSNLEEWANWYGERATSPSGEPSIRRFKPTPGVPPAIREFKPGEEHDQWYERWPRPFNL